ncbi:PilZ domain-containing protein [Sphingobium baderi]|uniref:Pilus assembly protein PilZ n=1 Tax=Sphingobium baderi TaxID=1332080 RepID=A0A0S3F216_9SPHN|nr:PilZ domain-containing protein [Sphingobium baderi]ALR21744.1 pilus assembly protein PilZ [Sphingobium baderi]
MGMEQDGLERGPARTSPRDSLFLLTNLVRDDGMPLCQARVRNLSATGLMAECERRIAVQTRLTLELRGVGKVSGQVAWTHGERIGVAFDRPIDPRLVRRPAGSGKRHMMPDYLRPHSIRAR